MKKHIAAAVLLCVFSFLLFCPPSASAEKGYENIKAAITQALGEGASFPESFFDAEYPNKETVSILFYTWNSQVALWGENEKGIIEGTIWESDLCVPLFGGYCGSWEQLEASLEDGYSLNIILQVEEDGELLLIDNLEKATIMHQAILGSQSTSKEE